MYYDIGDIVAVSSKELIGVFDIDATTVSKKTRDYLNLCENKENWKIYHMIIYRCHLLCRKNEPILVQFLPKRYI